MRRPACEGEGKPCRRDNLKGKAKLSDGILERRQGRAGGARRGYERRMDALRSHRGPRASPIRARRIHPHAPSARHPGGHLRATGRRLAAGRGVRAGPREADGCASIAPGREGVPDPSAPYPSARPASLGRSLLAVSPPQAHQLKAAGRQRADGAGHAGRSATGGWMRFDRTGASGRPRSERAASIRARPHPPAPARLPGVRVVSVTPAPDASPRPPARTRPRARHRRSTAVSPPTYGNRQGRRAFRQGVV